VTATAPAPPAASPPARGRRWAAGTLLVVSVILAGTLAGQRFVAARRLAAAHVPDPRDPPIAALALVHPEGIVADVTALDGRRLVMLAGPPPLSCPPDVLCDHTPTYDSLLALDAATGETIWLAPLGAGLRHPTAVVVADLRGLGVVVDVVTRDAVTAFDAATGLPRATFALPHGATTSAQTTAAASDDGAVALIAQEAGAPVLLAFDALSGAVRFDVPLPAQSVNQGPVMAAGSGVALVLTAVPGETLLTAYATANGAPRASVAVKAGMRLGPVDGERGRIYLFAPSGATATLELAGVLAAGPASLAAPHPVAPDFVPWLSGALAVGWNGTLGHLYAVDATRVRVLDAATGKALAALPLGASLPATTPLPVDEADGVFALPAGGGAVLVLGDGRTPPGGVSNAITAAILARSAYTRIVAQGPQRPAFVTTTTFLPGPSLADVPFWTHDDAVGWQSASPGSAAIAVAPAAHGGYDVTFTIHWTQHGFLHIHTTVAHVAPAGGVQLVRDGGDPLP
jgi:hypothetical protein